MSSELKIKMLDIVLIRLPFIYPRTQKKGNVGTPPLGLAYLAGALKKNGFQYMLIDGLGESLDSIQALDNTDLLVNGLTAKQIVDRIPIGVKCIGVSCMFTNEWYYCIELIRQIRERFPDAYIILGGEHPTADPEFCFQEAPEVDLIAVGEGEQTLIDLLNAIKKDFCFSNVSGIYYRNGSKVLKTSPRKRIQDLDEIAWPDWDSVPIEQYLSRRIAHGISGKRGMPMLASRGCPFQCTFCSNPTMWGTKWLVRSPDDVISEIKYYVSKYKITHFDFFDLTAIINEKWIIEFCEKLIMENLNLTWALPTGTRSEALSQNVLSLLKKSGCLKLVYAPESGSQETLIRIKKKINLEKMIFSMKESVRVGIITRANIVIGFPGQTRFEIIENYKFVLKLSWIGLQDIAVFSFSPYPGSELHDQLVKEGWINKTDNRYTKMMASCVTNDPNPKVSWNKDLNHRQIAWIIWTLVFMFYFLQFVFRPWRIVNSFQRLFRGERLTTLEVILPRMIRNAFTFQKL